MKPDGLECRRHGDVELVEECRNASADGGYLTNEMVRPENCLKWIADRRIACSEVISVPGRSVITV